jgi:hypothetical protein
MFKLPKLSLGEYPKQDPDRRDEMALWFVLRIYTL